MNYIEENNCCISCGDIIPEGSQVCKRCLENASKPKRQTVVKEKKRSKFWSLLKKERG